MKKYMFIFKTHTKKLVLLGIITIISSILNILITYIGGKYLDIVSATSSFNLVYAVCAFFFGITAVNLLFSYMLSFFMNPLIEMFIFEFKKYILDHLKQISLIDYSKFNISYLSKRIDEDSRQISEFFVGNYITAAIKVFEVISIMILVFNINFAIGVLMVLLCPIYFALYNKFKNPIFRKNLLLKEKTAEFFQDYTYQLEYLEDIIIDAKFENEDNLLKKKYLLYIEKVKEFVVVNSKLSLTQGLILGVMQIVIFLVGGVSIIKGLTTIGGLSILMSYFLQILKNITYYIELAKKYQMTKSSIFRQNEILDIPKQNEGHEKLQNVNKIDANISFAIGEKNIFENIRVFAEKGDVIGVVGKNGAGKTTLMKIIIGALKTCENMTNNYILYNDNHKLEDMDSIYMREKCLIYIPQKIRFRDVTVEETFNDKNNFRNCNELIEYICKLGMDIPKGIQGFLEKNWSEKVNRLSGGDKQFVMILSNIIKEGDLLILDEPTSNLDTDRIEWFSTAITKIKNKKITFVITHDEKIISLFNKTIKI